MFEAATEKEGLRHFEDAGQLLETVSQFSVFADSPNLLRVRFAEVSGEFADMDYKVERLVLKVRLRGNQVVKHAEFAMVSAGMRTERDPIEGGAESTGTSSVQAFGPGKLLECA